MSPQKERRRTPRPDNATDTSVRQRPRGKVNAYFTHHLWVLVSSLGALWRTPFATVMTAAVIGIALALPAGLHVLLQNVQKLSTSWEGTAQMSLFLKQDVSEKRIQSLAKKLRGWDGVAEVRYISREQALEEFRKLSGFGGALDSLNENPLPAVLVVRPTSEAAEPGQMELLLGKVKKLKPVDLAQLDMEWVRRLSGIIELGKRGVLLLGSLREQYWPGFWWAYYWDYSVTLSVNCLSCITASSHWAGWILKPPLFYWVPVYFWAY